MAKKKNGRGISAIRIIMHRKVHELHREYVSEEGEKAKYLGKAYFADKIAAATGYSPITVSRIMNSKETEE